MLKNFGHLAPVGCGLRPIAYFKGHGFCGTDGIFVGQRAVLTLEDGRKLAITIDGVDAVEGRIEFHSAASTC